MGWNVEHRRRVAHLMGRMPGRDPWSPVDALCKAGWGDLSGLAADQGPGLAASERKAWAREELRKLIDAEVATLESLRPTLDDSAIAADRDEAGRRALFDPSREATLARKYEAAVERGLYHALRELRTLAKEGPPIAEAEAPTPEAALASSLPGEPASDQGCDQPDRRQHQPAGDRPVRPLAIRLHESLDRSTVGVPVGDRRGPIAGSTADWVDNPESIGGK